LSIFQVCEVCENRKLDEYYVCQTVVSQQALPSFAKNVQVDTSKNLERRSFVSHARPEANKTIRAAVPATVAQWANTKM